MYATQILCGAVIASFLLAGGLQAEELPEDAQRLMAAFAEDEEAIRYEAERKIAIEKRELIKQLKVLQDQYTRAAKLDEAVAIRDQIRALKESMFNAQPAPANLLEFRNQVQGKFYFKVTGNKGGSLYGTDVYTADSTLATAAVHSGVLKDGEIGVVRVTILPGRANYVSSTRNGITSNAWGNYSSSFQVDKVKQFPGFETEEQPDDTADEGGTDVGGTVEEDS